MDRNTQHLVQFPRRQVALRKESVDRNVPGAAYDGNIQASLSARRAWIEIPVSTAQRVALRKESVDRNSLCGPCGRQPQRSLSARRAWIEIVKSMSPMYLTLSSLSARRAWIEIRNIWYSSQVGNVALRKESVDRNAKPGKLASLYTSSLSARRAWIEIIARLSHFSTRRVALRKESVDRNTYFQFLSPP